MRSIIDLGLKNIFRQKTRTILTIIGVMIGIAAIVTLGSISEGLRRDISQNLEQASGQIYVYEESNSPLFIALSTSKLSEDTVNEIIDTDGVKDYAEYVMDVSYIDDDQSFGQPTLFISGVDPEKITIFLTENAEIEEGEELAPGDIYMTTIGIELAEALDVEVGDTLEIKKENFIIKGIYEEFGDPGIDSGAIIPLDTALDILETDEYSGVVLYPEDLDDVEEIASNIEENIEDITATTTEEFANQISGIIDQIQIFTVGVAAISAIVGGLGVMNTMIMSVMERKREIGVLKAVGATNGYVLRLILLESSLLSLIGGLIGLLVGLFGSFVLTIASNGSINGYVSMNLVIKALGFAIILGIIGGYYPSKKASNLSPVEALMYE